MAGVFDAPWLLAVRRAIRIEAEAVPLELVGILAEVVQPPGPFAQLAREPGSFGEPDGQFGDVPQMVTKKLLVSGDPFGPRVVVDAPFRAPVWPGVYSISTAGRPHGGVVGSPIRTVWRTSGAQLGAVR